MTDTPPVVVTVLNTPDNTEGDETSREVKEVEERVSEVEEKVEDARTEAEMAADAAIITASMIERMSATLAHIDEKLDRLIVAEVVEAEAISDAIEVSEEETKEVVEVEPPVEETPPKSVKKRKPKTWRERWEGA